MGNKKVDMVEIHAFSDDLQQISLDMHSQLEKVIKSIDTIQGMSSFSGKAAKDAKRYFQALHVTVLTAFQGLFKDLEVNLRQHISTFESEVDDSESAIVTSHYLEEVREDIEETFEKLTSEEETIHDIISEVSDLTSATSPDFSDVNEWQKKAVKATKELEEDMSSFTSTGNETDVQAIMQQIETVMNKAKGSTGEARFEGFEGVSSIKALRKLTDYNEEKENKRNKEIEEARDIRDRALKNADRSSKMVGDKAFIDYQGGKITKEAYIEIMTTLGKVQKELGEDELDEEVSETFLEYLWNNKVEFATDTTISSIIEYAGTHGSMKLGGMINTFRGIKGDGFVMVNPKSSQVAQPFLNPKTHKWAVNIGKWSGRVATPVGFGVGWYDDVQNQDKTHGQAIAHNSVSTGAGFGTSALLLGFAGSNPGGWAILGIVAAGVGVSIGVDYLYRNNKTVEKSVDWVGNRLSDIGQGIKSFFNGSNAANTKYRSPGFNAP